MATLSGFGAGYIFGSSSRGAGASLSASSKTFFANVSAGALIASLSQPFGSGTVYSTVGTVPGQLALSSGTITAGSTTATAGTSYSVKIRATSADGKREVAETLSFAAQAAAGVTPPATGKQIALASSARGIWIGDSYTDITYSAGVRNHGSWTRYLLNGAVRMAVGGQNMAIAGTRLVVSNAANGIYADNSMLSRVQNQIRYMKPDFLVLLGGVNDLGPYSNDTAQINDAWGQVYNSFRSYFPTTPLFACTVCYTTAAIGTGGTGANGATGTTGGTAATRAAIEALNAHILSVIANDNYAAVIDYNSVYNPNTMSVGDAVSHPNALGGYTLGTKAASVIGQYVAAGSVLPASTATDAGQLDTHFAMTGTSGTAAGTATGSVATGKTLTGLAGGATIVASKAAATVGEIQVLTGSGTPTAVGNATLTETLSVTGSAPGDFYELLSEVGGIAAADGSAPKGVLQFGDSFAAGEGFLAGSSDANAIAIPYVVPAGVIRSVPLHTNSASASQVATAFSIRSAAVANDFIAKVGRQFARKIDTVAYALPFNFSLDGKTSANYKTQITGTVANGSVNTVRPDGWSGGGLTFSYQWDKNGAPISGATNLTYTPTGFVTGDVLGCTVTPTNSFGSASTRVVTAAFS